MHKQTIAILFALISIAINVYIVWRGREGKISAEQQQEYKKISLYLIWIAFLIYAFGHHIGLH